MADPYRTAADRGREPHPLDPLAGTFTAQIRSLSSGHVVLHSDTGAGGISLIHYGFAKLSAAQRAAIGALIDSGNLRVTVEVLP